LILTVLLVVAVVLVIVWLVGTSVYEFKDTLSTYSQPMSELGQRLQNTSSKLGIDADTLTADPLLAPDQMLHLVVTFVSGIVSGLSNWGLALVVCIFLLVEENIFPRKMQSVAEDDDPDVLRILNLAKELREYMGINALLGLLFAALNVILLIIMGVDFAILWGLLAFFMSFVPAVGLLIAIFPPALLALMQFGVTEMMIVIAAYFVSHTVLYSVIKPLFIEKEVNISVAVTFLSLVVWGWVLGPIGAILSVPMTIIVQTILDSREETRWLAYMMGSGSEPFKPKEELDQETLE
jgi:AI-2 transport protein TqsA